MDELTKKEINNGKSKSNLIVKVNTTAEPSPPISFYFDNRKRQNKGRGKSPKTCKEQLYGNKFKAIQGVVYYNPKDTSKFILASSNVKGEVKKDFKSKEYYKPSRTSMGTYANTFVVSPKDCREMKAIGKTLAMTEKRITNYSMQREAKPEDTHTCKRFSERWQRMIEVLLENNRAMKVQNRLNLSPTEEEVEENTNCMPQVTRTTYKSYLKERHRNLFTKDNMISEYCCANNDKELSLDFHCDSEVVFSKALGTHKRKFDVTSAKGELGFKSLGELIKKLSELEEQLKLQERVKRIKNMAMSDIAIRSLKTKYDSLYSHFEALKTPERRVEDKVSILRQGIANVSHKLNILINTLPKPEPNTSILDRDQKKDKEKKGDTYLTEVVTVNKEESMKNEGKVHLGSEEFPEILLTKFNSQKHITAIQRSCIENLMRKKWGACKLKIKKDPNAYHIILYGNLCPLSNCCNSLTITNIQKDSGCKMCCMNKLCITRILDWFTLPLEANEILFSEEKRDVIRKEMKKRRSAETTAKKGREEYRMDSNDSGLESSLFYYGKGRGGIGLVIEKKQRMPLIKAKYLSLIVK